MQCSRKPLNQAKYLAQTEKARCSQCRIAQRLILQGGTLQMTTPGQCAWPSYLFSTHLPQWRIGLQAALFLRDVRFNRRFSCHKVCTIEPQKLHNLAAHAHTAAATAHGKGDHLTAHELSEQAHEYSMNAYKHDKESHTVADQSSKA